MGGIAGDKFVSGNVYECLKLSFCFLNFKAKSSAIFSNLCV